MHWGLSSERSGQRLPSSREKGGAPVDSGESPAESEIEFSRQVSERVNSMKTEFHGTFA